MRILHQAYKELGLLMILLFVCILTFARFQSLSSSSSKSSSSSQSTPSSISKSSSTLFHPHSPPPPHFHLHTTFFIFIRRKLFPPWVLLIFRPNQILSPIYSFTFLASSTFTFPASSTLPRRIQSPSGASQIVSGGCATRILELVESMYKYFLPIPKLKCKDI